MILTPNYMFEFFKKIKQKIEAKKEEDSFQHLLKKYTVNDINFLSNSKKVLILKHSQRCIVSRTIMKQFLKLYNSNPEKFYYLIVDVIESRTLSNEIYNEYKIIHQSPQVLIIDKCKCTYSKSHNEINFNEIDENF